MIQILKNYSFELLPFKVHTDFLEYTLEEGEWGIVEVNPDTGELEFKCLDPDTKITAEQAVVAHLIVRGSNWYAKDPNWVEPGNYVSTLEKKRGLYLKTDKYLNVTGPTDLTLIGQANKGAVFTPATAGDPVIARCLAKLTTGEIIVILT